MTRQKPLLTGLLLAVLLSLSACGSDLSFLPFGQQAAETTAVIEPVATEDQTQTATAVDTDQIVAQVIATLNAQSAGQPQDVAIVPAVNASPEILSAGVDLQTTLVDLYRRVNNSVVYVYVPNVGSGSGFVYDDQGHIVTNRHVVAEASTVEVVFGNGERREAEILGADVDGDLAVLQVKDVPAGIEPLPLAAGSPQVGEFVVAIGSPFGEQGSMTLGIVSGLGRSLRSQRTLAGGSSYSLPQVIQTDAPINPGNSGGPLLNLQGEVVGINAAIASTSGTGSGVGFSIPVAAIKLVVPSLIESGSYDYPYMGVSFANELTLESQQEFGLTQATGVYVLEVAAGGPAAQAGLIAADPQTGRGGDLVIAIDGNTVKDFGELNSYLVFETQVGQTINLTVLRDGQEAVVPLILGARP